MTCCRRVASITIPTRQRWVTVALPRDQHVGTSSSSSLASSSSSSVRRSYATKATKGSTGSGGKKVADTPRRGARPGADAGDARLEAVKKALLESSPTDEERLKALAAVLPPLEAHETITRAFALFKRQRRESHEAELGRKYESMRNALQLLEETDKGLFDKATKGRLEGDEGLIPRRARIPLDFAPPGTALWDSEWKAPPPPPPSVVAASSLSSSKDVKASPAQMK